MDSTKVRRAGWTEVPCPQILGMEPVCRAFQKTLDDGHLTCIVGWSKAHGWHLSLSHRLNIPDGAGIYQPGRQPTWDELKTARYLFIPDHVYMAQILPPAKEYINIHETTHHLHEISEGAFNGPQNAGPHGSPPS